MLCVEKWQLFKKKIVKVTFARNNSGFVSRVELMPNNFIETVRSFLKSRNCKMATSGNVAKYALWFIDERLCLFWFTVVNLATAFQLTFYVMWLQETLQLTVVFFFKKNTVSHLHCVTANVDWACSQYVLKRSLYINQSQSTDCDDSSNLSLQNKMWSFLFCFIPADQFWSL